MLLFKAKTYFIGFLLSLLPNKVFIKLVDGTNAKIGLNMTNDDYPYKFSPKIVRINKIDLSMGMVHYFKDNDVDYYIQIGRSEDSYNVIAQEIIETDISLNGLKKPLFYAVVNEDNDYKWQSIDQIDQYIRINYGKYIHVTKGSYTSIVESAGLKKYKEHFDTNLGIVKDKYHLIHFYLKPVNEIDNIIDNTLRKLMIRYMIYKISKFVPANKIVISESHDASKSAKIIIKKEELRPYTDNNGKKDGDVVLKVNNDITLLVERFEGDFVFASKEGWIQLEKLFKSLGVYGGLYYHQPFLTYKGNTVLQARE